MGATVFIQANIFSFPTDNGRIGYVWSEETYDKKDGPSNANWCVMAIGHREQMVERAFGLAGSVPGGMLKVRNTSTQAFIKAMMDRIDQPQLLERTHLTLDNSRAGFYDAIQDKNREAVRQVLERHGKAAESQAVSASVQDGGSKITLDLAKDLELVIALTKRGHDGNGIVLPWRVIRSTPRGYAPIGPAESPAVSKRPTPVDIQILRTSLSDECSTNDFHICLVDGQFLCAGKPWEIECELTALSGRSEAISPGYYKGALKGFKVACDNMVEAPAGTAFVVDATQAGRWAQDDVAELREKLLGEKSLTFEISLNEVKQAFTNLPDSDAVSMRYALARVLSNTKLTKVVLPELEAEQLFERERG